MSSVSGKRCSCQRHNTSIVFLKFMIDLWKPCILHDSCHFMPALSGWRLFLNENFGAQSVHTRRTIFAPKEISHPGKPIQHRLWKKFFHLPHPNQSQNCSQSDKNWCKKHGAEETFSSQKNLANRYFQCRLFSTTRSLYLVDQLFAPLFERKARKKSNILEKFNKW